MDTSVVTESRLVLAGAGRRGEWGVSNNGCGVSVGDDENILELDSGDSCIQPCE